MIEELVLTPAQRARREGFPHVYHLLHMANLGSVLEHGLLSRRVVDARGIPVTSLQSQAVRSARSEPITLPDGRSVPLDHFVPVRFYPSTPVLATLAYDWRKGAYSRENQEFLVLLEIDVDALDQAEELWFATTSPFGKDCRFIPGERFEEIRWDRLREVRARHGDFSDPVARSEVLLAGSVSPALIRACVVCDDKAASRLRALGVEKPVTVRPEWYFGF